MTIRQRTRLRVEALESRVTPAATAAVKLDTLVITGDNTPNDVVITEVGTDTFRVGANTQDLGTFTAKNISIKMGKDDDDVRLALTAALRGNLTVDLQGGNDFFSTADSVRGARVDGNVSIKAGTASKVPVTDEDGNEDYDEVIQLFNLDLNGPKVTVSGAAGSSTQLLAMESAHVAGTLAVTNVHAISLGKDGDAAGAVTVGALTVTNTKKNTDRRVNSPAASGPAVGNVLWINCDSRVNGDLSYTGGSGRDDINLPGDITPRTDVTIGGNLTFRSGNGVNTLSLGNGLGCGAQIHGSVSFTGGTGIDRFFLDSGTRVDGDVTLKLGNGRNQVFGDISGKGGSAMPINPAGSAAVGGNLSITLGNGHDFIGTYAGDATLTVGGNFQIKAGSGNRLGGDANAPGAITLFNNNVTVGGTASYAAKRGSQTIVVGADGTRLPALWIAFASGANTVRFTAATYAGSVRVDFGRGPGQLHDADTQFAGEEVVLGKFTRV